jgi:uncharacterized protein (UPF0261 family)
VRSSNSGCRPTADRVATVVLMGTLDTKGREYAFVRDRLRDAGVVALVVDVGILGEPPFPPDVSAAEVAALAGRTLEELRFGREGSDTRWVALETMAEGAAALVRRLHDEGRCQGLLGLAGSGGSTVVSAAMRALPVGVPKLLVTTMAGTVGADYVGTRDVCLMSSVTDIAGLNRVSRAVLTNAAVAVAAMARSAATGEAGGAPLVALTMMGVTTPAVLALQSGLEALGFETIVFHAVGSGGRALEEMVADGLIDAVVDVTTHELVDHELGGIFDAGPDRLAAIARSGIPLVAVPGATEFVNFGARATVPAHLDVLERPIVVHNPSVCAVRTTSEEQRRLGRIFAAKVNEATGRAVVVLPLRGLSRYEEDGGPFVNVTGDQGFFAAVRETLRKEVVLEEVDASINEPAFVEAALAAFGRVWAGA